MKYIIVNELIKLMQDINIKEIPENENLKQLANIVEKLLNFNKQQKDTRLKILTPKEML